MLRRRKPLKRGGPLKRKARLSPVSKRRAAQRADYTTKRAAHLKAHPLCQITMARHRINEGEALAELLRAISVNPFLFRIEFRGITIPLATEIHHRNRSNGKRYVDDRFFMSACRAAHAWAESNPITARAIGILLSINARPDGSMPDGSQCLTTEELMRTRAANR